MNEDIGGYSPKSLVFDDKGRAKLVKGIETISKAVKSTLGPGGATVLIESQKHVGGITVTKDGVTVAKDVDLLDPVENMAVKIMRQAADRTAASAGDGTTTSIVLAEALAVKGMELITEGVNKTEVLRDLVEETKLVVKSLAKNSKKVTKGKLKDVATISANNEPVIGNIIAKVYKAVGKNGLVTVGKSQTSETHFEATTGMKIDRGYSSNLFINNQAKDECIMEDVLILVSDAEISNLPQIPDAIFAEVIRNKKKLLIIAPCSTGVINALATNVVKSNLGFCAIEPPSFGYMTNELMQDIATSIGATYFSEKTGDDLSHMKIEDLGFASKIVVGRDSTIIVKGNDSQKEIIEKRVAELRVSHKNASKKADKDFILSRIASLTGGVGVIYAGGKTDLEQKELYDRIDDAVCAVRSALEKGILPGGGVALYKESLKFSEKNSIASKILSYALRQPMVQIWKNAGIPDVVKGFKDSSDYSWGYDVKNDVCGNMFDMGVIDPLKVTESALQNAVSVAVTILSTNAIITMARSYEGAN
jgi:chaperonin GroEL